MRFLLLALLAGTASASTLTFTFGDAPILTYDPVPANVTISSDYSPNGFGLNIEILPNGTPTAAAAHLSGVVTITGGIGSGRVQWLTRDRHCDIFLATGLAATCSAAISELPDSFTFGAPIQIQEVVTLASTASGSAIFAGIIAPEVIGVYDLAGKAIDVNIDYSGTGIVDVTSPEPSTWLLLTTGIVCIVSGRFGVVRQ